MKHSTKHSTRSRLIEARKDRKWSQQEVASRIGTTSNNVSRWELGQTTPGPYFRAKLCALFGISVEELGLVDEPVVRELSSSSFVSRSTTMLLPAERQRTVWYVPSPRNALFTGRADLLRHLHERFCQQFPAAPRQPLAISGLSGIGKTQIALEYAYRHAQQYQAILWVNAETREMLLTDFVAMAHLLALPPVEQQTPEQVVEAVKQWLQQQGHWLLVFDNVEDLGIIQPFLPASRSGHLLLTTRLQATGTLAHRLHLDRMEPEEGALLLLRRARLVSADAQASDVPEHLRSLAREICELLDGLPLALDQAGAFIAATGCGLAAYCELYEYHAAALHTWRSQSTPAYPHAVNTTLALSFQQEAEPLYERALRIREQTLERERRSRAETLHSLAELRAIQGYVQEATFLRQHAFSIREYLQGGEHPPTRARRTTCTAHLEHMTPDQRRSDDDVLVESCTTESMGNGAPVPGETRVGDRAKPRCPHCSSETAVIKSGKNRSGTQRFLCRSCVHSFTPDARQQGLAPSLREQAVVLNARGSSTRAIARTLGVDHQTVRRWLQATRTKPVL